MIDLCSENPTLNFAQVPAGWRAPAGRCVSFAAALLYFDGLRFSAVAQHPRFLLSVMDDLRFQEEGRCRARLRLRS
jgi:hypothetical protein